MRRLSLCLLLLSLAAPAAAQRPGAFSVLTVTGSTANDLCIGCAVGSSTATGTANLGVLTVAGASTLTGNTTVGGTLGVTGNTTVGGTLGVTGLSTLTSLTVSGAFTISGAASFPGGVSTDGTGAGAGNLRVTGTASVTGLTTLNEALLFNTAGTPGAGRIYKSAISGLIVYPPAGSVNDLVLANSAGATVATIPTGTVGLTLAGTATVTGLTTLNDALLFNTAGTSGVGRLYKSATSGLVVWPPAGSTNDFVLANSAGATVASVATGTVNLMLTGPVSVGSTNVTDAIAVPTITSGFGGGATIAGRAYGFTITIGTGSPTTGVVAFNTTYANTVPCTVGSSNASDAAFQVVPTASTLTLGFAALTAGDKIFVLCRGY